MKPVNTYVGSSVERVEDERFLRGAGIYIDDIERQGQWHAAVLRSTVAHGNLRVIESSAALALSGVHAVMTASDVVGPLPTIPFRRPNPKIAPYAQPVIAASKVRYVGAVS